MAEIRFDTAPTEPRPSTPSTIPTGSSGSGGGGGGGKARDPYAAAQARADAKERKAQRKAAERYRAQAKTLGQQVDAIEKALSKKGYRKALEQRLANVNLVYRQQDRQMRRDYRARVGNLEESFEDNEKAHAGQTQAAITNRSRERANALSEVSMQGAGETDALRAQAMSLRNWQANQSDIARNYFDSATTINTALTDLTVDTRTNRMNLANQRNTDRGSAWTDYFNNQSEMYTQLGNLRGQQSEFYGMAAEVAPGGGGADKKRRNRLDRQSGAAFMDAANLTGRVWENPGIPSGVRNWEGRDEFETVNNASRWENRASVTQLGRPEGASLRKWTT